MEPLSATGLPPEANRAIFHNDDEIADLRLRGDDIARRAEERNVERMEAQRPPERIETEDEVVLQNRDGDRAEFTRRGMEASAVAVNNPV